MIKLIMNNQKLKEAYDIASKEQRTLLGVIYSDYIIPRLPPKSTITPKNIYANRNLILKLMKLEKELSTEDLEMIYLQFGPSVNYLKRLNEDELLVVL